jgi:beta-lactamase regulating signal transducer with metallopeptidase domain
VELRWNDQLGPCAAGWLRPVILLPRGAADWPEEMRPHVIIHELAHFRRRDLWLQVLTRLIAAAHWFNPLSIVLRRWTEAEREQACDSLVVRHGGDALAYARFLLAFASGRTLRASAPVATLLSHRRSQLERRIRALLSDVGPEPRRWRIRDVAFAIPVILLFVACSISGSDHRSTTSATATMEREVQLRLSADPFPGEK